MSASRRTLAISALLCVVLLSACASPTANDAAPGSGGAIGGVLPGLPGLPDGEVIAQGTVLDAAGTAELCLGGIMESLPPQCSGVPLIGWDWQDAPGSEAAGDARWGAYAVYGTYDGQTLTVTRPPILLALYDPVAPEDPTGGEPGPADTSRLTEVQDDIHARLGDAVLTSWPQDGRLWVQVVWDDGTLQDAADAAYGDDMVVVQSSLREVG